ncbi:hypothetical protein [Agromyces albus]|uniref:Uncharacterized protein n=1 Tax=Agromyces albus TaxID=205332 RepID=A0A4Q2L672_9MICO|nr:hypothetical protein [Agromyces albus]RXZ71983.1 hypothetical protein ESP51_06330 [Agromyces albus]
MGRQAKAFWIDAGERTAVTLHLESDALEVSGGRRAKVPRSEFRHIGSADGVVEFEAGGDRFRFELGDAASAWAKALATPAPTLAEKLGVAHGETVAVRGELPMIELTDALSDSARVAPWEAAVVVAVVRTETELVSLPGWLRECGVGVAPVWIVHGRGRATSAPGDTAVRAVMRAHGFHDTKVSAIGGTWSATRYSPPKNA